MSQALNRRRQQSTLRSLTIAPPNAVDFSSNDFLSLATSRELRSRFLQELDSSPTLQAHLGSGGSRLLDGNSAYAESLEREIAHFHRAPAALLCNSGYDANVGLFSTLPQPGDLVIYDELIHASVHDGLRLARTGRPAVPFAHNDVSALKATLETHLASDPTLAAGRRNLFIAVEAVYSMDGDVAPLAAIVALTRSLLPHGNAHLVVDEAHSTGVLGPGGRGLVCALGLEAAVAVRLHTFGKALAAQGAALLCAPLCREYLVNYARPLIYTTFLSYPALAGVRAAYAYLRDGHVEPRRENLRRLIGALHERLLAMQEAVVGQLVAAMDAETALAVQQKSAAKALLSCPDTCPTTPIFALRSSEPRALANYCQQRGLVVRAIVPPTVPVGEERVRVCLHAGNTVEEIERLVSTMREWVEQQLRESSSASGLPGGEARSLSLWRARL